MTETPNVRYNMRFLWLACLVAAMGGLLFGYDWVVISGAKPFFERHFNLVDANVRGWANSCALIGCLVGALIAGALSDRFGRKRLLIGAAGLFVITSIGNGLAPTFAAFVAWRMLGGVAIGLASNLSPMYIAEISPASMRGRFVGINQLTIVIGVTAAQVINVLVVWNLPDAATDEFIRTSWYGQTAWRWMFGFTSIPALLFFVSMFFVPESPRWLVKNGRSDRAKDILARVGGADYAASTVSDIQSTIATQEVQRVRFADLLDRRMMAVLILGVTLAVFQQWCGINTLSNYAEEFFRGAGYGVRSALSNLAWTGIVHLAFTFVALGVVDRGGRRPLMLFGAAGLAVTYTVFGACYARNVQGWPMVAMAMVAIAVYSMSLAPVTWVVISEIFPNRIRGAAVSVSVAALWTACFVLTYTFPSLKEALGMAGTLWLYAGICVAGFLFIKLKLPETKGKTLEQIERELVD